MRQTLFLTKPKKGIRNTFKPQKKRIANNIYIQKMEKQHRHVESFEKKNKKKININIIKCKYAHQAFFTPL